MGEDVPMEQQAEVARVFLDGLVERFGASATVEVRPIDEDTVELAVVGDDLGLLIGPKGNTLAAVQELARTVVQRKTGGRNGRLLVDVGGYRQARREALERFTRQVADEVKASGRARGLEPMSPADRKVVHDTVNDIDGVETTSEGEEPRRRVVIVPVS
jgi:spoIIIJ-associated protein